MRISLLNLISTPVPVLNTIGLNLRVGLSSEDPTVVGHIPETYTAYLSIYSPEGLLLDRLLLGSIPPERRRFFDISAITHALVPALDHLSVVHRIPTKLLAQVSSVEDEIELPTVPEYPLFRSVVEYSYPGGGNGSVIYETPPGLNASTSSSNTLTFTCQTLLSASVNTFVVLTNYSVNPSYSGVANYHFALHSLSGERVVTDNVTIGPFAIRILDLAHIIPREVVQREMDPQDGLSTFTFVGYSEDASIVLFAVNAAPDLGAVAVEHTHPPQSYIIPSDPSYQRRAKTEAQIQWKSILGQQIGADNRGNE